MPTFEVQSGGKTFEVEAPDMQTAVKALSRRRLLSDEEIMGGRPGYRALFAPTETEYGANPFADLIPSKKRLLSDEEILAAPPVDGQRNPWDELIREHQRQAPAGRNPWDDLIAAHGAPNGPAANPYSALIAPGADLGGLQSPETRQRPWRGKAPSSS